MARSKQHQQSASRSIGRHNHSHPLARRQCHTRAPRSRRLRIEPLEQRMLLSVTTWGETVQPAESQLGPPGEPGALEVSSEVVAPSESADVPGMTNLTPADVARAINAFALDLYHQLQDEQGNLFLSPFSTSTALAMVYAGARGETGAQIADVLHLPFEQESLHEAFGSLIDALNAAGGEDFELATANALWGQEGFPFREEFLELIASDYGGGLEEVDFFGDTEGARQTINAWVEEQTHDKILDLIPRDALHASTVLVLTNAIYFKGDWIHRFDPADTCPALFTPLVGEDLYVDMMHQTARFRYMNRDGFQVLEMPYAGDRLSMVVLLPEESGTSTMDVAQIPTDLGNWLEGLSEERVAVSFPKFEITTGFGLANVLRDMGMTDAFSDAADLSGMARADLQIQKVIHKAFVGVGEEGTEAAAATAITFGLTSAFRIPAPPPVRFVADHPFHFLIRDNESGAILFVGRLTDPPKASNNARGVDLPVRIVAPDPPPREPQPANPAPPLGGDDGGNTGKNPADGDDPTPGDVITPPGSNPLPLPPSLPEDPPVLEAHDQAVACWAYWFDTVHADSLFGDNDTADDGENADLALLLMGYWEN